MKTRLIKACWVAAVMASAAQAAPAVIETEVVKRSPEAPIVSLAVGSTDGARVGDPIWVFDNRGLASCGEVYLVTDAACTCRLVDERRMATAGMSVSLFRRSVLPALRNNLLPGVTIRGTLTRVTPGHDSAWLDLGTTSGLRINDSMLIRRNHIPISRGRVAALESDSAVVILEPLVSNALPKAGDGIEVWPWPGLVAQGRLNGTVLDVRPGDEGAILTITACAADGVVIDQLVDIYRRGAYVGVAAIETVGTPLSEARLVEPASRETPRVGDEAIVRSLPRRGQSRPLKVVVWRVDEDYCLISACEQDGVKAGDRFLVRHVDPDEPTVVRDVAELIVATVKIDYAGAHVRYLGNRRERLRVWDEAERVGVPAVADTDIGLVEEVWSARRTLRAPIAPGLKLSAASVLRWDAGEGGAAGSAVLIRVADQDAVLYVPRGWGEPKEAVKARVAIAGTIRTEPIRIAPATMPVRGE